MIYQYSDANLKGLDSTTFINEKILERQHLQKALKNNIEVVADDCLVISEEFSFSDWSDSGRRIDILAINKDANLVIIELKRDETGDHMELQAIRYAAMVSTLTYKKVIKIYKQHLDKEEIEEDAEDKLLEFLGWDEPNEEEFALDVILVLVSADFSSELTTSVLWLNERNLDIRCVRLIPYKYNDDILLATQQVIPLPEAAEYQVRLREKQEERRRAIQSRDYTQYEFKGNSYNKRRLVLAVVKAWVKKHPPRTIDELTSVFPQEINNGNLFVELSKAMEVFERQNRNRHFLDEEDIIRFTESADKYVLTNQWGRDNIGKFIDHDRKLGYVIEPSD